MPDRLHAGAPGAAVSELPLKQNDHAMDATRYALHTFLSQTRAADAYLATIQRRVELREGERRASRQSTAGTRSGRTEVRQSGAGCALRDFSRPRTWAGS